MGIGGDNDTNYQLIDHAIVGVRSKLKGCSISTLPFFGKLQHEELDVECFPYRIAMASWPARANKLEPFYYSRDPNECRRKTPSSIYDWEVLKKSEKFAKT